MKIIDAHVHLVQCIAGTGAGGELRSCGGGQGIYADGSVCALIPPAWGTDQVTPERMLELMDAHQVERAVLLQGGYLGFQNLYSWQAQQQWPHRFWRLPPMILTAVAGMRSYITCSRSRASGW